MDMSGKGVVITGASRGIGADTARVFAAAGAQVALLARDEAAIADLAGEVNGIAIPCDVSKFWQVEQAIAAATREFGSLDVLINNAGVLEPIVGLADADPDAWGHVIDVNTKGVFYGMRAALPIMQAQGSGTILTVSSGAAHGAMEGWSAYCTSKAGAAMLTKAAHLEHPDLRIMGLSPGTVATQMQRDIAASGVNPVSQIPWEAHIPADWPAKALLWMCGEGAAALNGTEVSLRSEDVRRAVGLT